MPAGARLVGGATDREGWLEVQLVPGGPWGAACILAWEAMPYTQGAARVVCRQLGHGGGEVHWGMEDAASSAGPPLIDALACEGDEASLQGCSFDGAAPGMAACYGHVPLISCNGAMRAGCCWACHAAGCARALCRRNQAGAGAGQAVLCMPRPSVER